MPMITAISCNNKGIPQKSIKCPTLSLERQPSNISWSSAVTKLIHTLDNALIIQNIHRPQLCVCVCARAQALRLKSQHSEAIGDITKVRRERSLPFPSTASVVEQSPVLNLFLKCFELNKEGGGRCLLSRTVCCSTRHYSRCYIHYSKLAITYLANILKESCFD